MAIQLRSLRRLALVVTLAMAGLTWAAPEMVADIGTQAMASVEPELRALSIWIGPGQAPSGSVVTLGLRN